MLNNLITLIGYNKLMERWIIFAFLSMFFAGLTAVIAKQGLIGISSELGLTVRTGFVALFVVIFALFFVSAIEIKQLTVMHYVWLGLSGATTALSWIFYYKALKMGDIATIALIDKGSVIIAIGLAWLFFKEVITLHIVLGCGLIVAGLLVIAKK